MNTAKVKAYAAQSAASALAPHGIVRREPGPTDVKIEILYCGVCHSDLHFARNEWGFTQYPAVPGHEIIGRVTAVGTGVTKFKVGDTGRRRLPRGFVPHLPRLPRGPRAILRPAW